MIVLPFTVVVDTSEQLPWSFQGFKGDAKEKNAPLVVPQVRASLDTGDYSVVGREHEFTIERKSLSDFFGTLTAGRDRFERELERMQVMACASHVVVEGEWSDVAREVGDHSIRPLKTFTRTVMSWTQRYPRTHWHMLPGRRAAESWALQLIRLQMRGGGDGKKEAGGLGGPEPPDPGRD